MKFILFSNLPYAFAILRPLEIVLNQSQDEVLWYVPKNIEKDFPYKDSPYTTDIDDLKEYKADVIFVPGNEVPYFLRGLKVQIFHGFAGEKKDHFRIREYFDLYLTQGPYFTDKFKALAKKHKNFDVIETGWSKSDELYHISEKEREQKEKYLKKYKKIILFSPTFSPSLTCADKIYGEVKKLLGDKSLLLICKFHDKMDREIVKKYQELKEENIIISQDKDISSLLKIADIMISDTSSVVYEFLLLSKPVITVNTISTHKEYLYDVGVDGLNSKLQEVLKDDTLLEKRQEIIGLYHPYNDGKSSFRMVKAVKDYLKTHPVPEFRKVSLFRKYKIWSKYR